MQSLGMHPRDSDRVASPRNGSQRLSVNVQRLRLGPHRLGADVQGFAVS